MDDTKPEPNRMQRLEALIQQAERFPDPAVKEHIREIVQILLEIHREGLTKVFEHLYAVEGIGQGLIDTLARDELVGMLLLLHGLHPQDVETRVVEALARVRPMLQSHGGDVELVGISAEMVRLRLSAGDGCGSTAAALRSAVEQAVYDAAPEVTAIEVEGEQPPPGPGVLVQLGLLQRS